MDDGSRDEWHSTLYWPEIKLYGDNAVERRGGGGLPCRSLATVECRYTT